MFEITWSGSQDARLYYLIDNDQVVLKKNSTHAPSITIEQGKISVTYQIPRKAAHRIEWSLMFPGETLADLKAKVTLNSGDPETRNAGGDKKHHWVEALDV